MKKILIKITGLLMMTMLCCEGFERNPDLVFLVNAEKSDCFSPIWSPDGEKIYYLDGWFEGFRNKGDIWCISLSSHRKEMLLEGEFNAIDVSPNGEKLGIVDSWYQILILDLKTRMINTIFTSSYRIGGIKFSSYGDKIFCSLISSSDSGGIWAIDLESKGNRWIIEVRRDMDWEFEVTSNDSVFILAIPQFLLTPLKYSVKDTLLKKVFVLEYTSWAKAFLTNSNFIVTSSGDVTLGDSLIRIIHLPDMDTITIDARIAEEGRIVQPCGSPDGTQIVFCAAEFVDWEAGHMENLSLWILKNVNKYIK